MMCEDSANDFKAKYYEPWGDIYKFMQKHYGAKTSDEWNMLVIGITLLEKKYNSDKFVNDLLGAVLAELERVYEKEM